MAIQAIGDPAQRGHLIGDVPALLLVTLAFAVLLPRATRENASGAVSTAV